MTYEGGGASRRIMKYCQTNPRGCALLIEGYHLRRSRVKGVVGQDTVSPQSPPGVSKPHRQAHEADPRTNRATCRAKEAAPGVLSGSGVDGSGAGSLRTRACLARGKQRASTAGGSLRPRHRREICQTRLARPPLGRQEHPADQNGRRNDETACQRRPHPQSERASSSPHRAVSVTTGTRGRGTMAKATGPVPAPVAEGKRPAEWQHRSPLHRY